MYCNSSPHLEKIFKSRLKKVSDDIMEFWALEIDKMKLSEEIMEDGVNCMLDDDEMILTLPKVKKAFRDAKVRWLTKNGKLIDYIDFDRCGYCQGTGTTLFAFKFDKLGNLTSQNTVMRCHCERAVNDLKHLRNKQNTKMIVSDGYIKAYTQSQWAYVMPIITKTGKDITTDWQNDVKYKEFCRNLAVQNESLRSLAKRTLESMPKCE